MTDTSDMPKKIWADDDGFSPVESGAWGVRDDLGYPHEYARADLAKPKVKPLVWVDVWGNETAFSTTFGTPEIRLASDGTYYWKGGNFRALEDAKAAAQADYERRILSALE